MSNSPSSPPALSGNWNYPTTVRCGAGRIRELPECCRSLGMERPLLVTDPGLAKLPLVADALAVNTDTALETGLFADIKPNPVVAAPTTSGTGSEVGRATAVIDEEAETKKILFHPRMLPELVICDPQLVTGLPPAITAATGMDALAHCLEAFCVDVYDPMADGIALEGIRLVRDWLPAAYQDGNHIAARAHMMAAAAMGATAFQKGLGAIHSLSHPVGAVFDTHHGLTNAVFMPYVLAFNQKAIGDKMERLARFIGLKKPSFQAVLEWTLDLRQKFEIPHTAAELGVAEGRVSDIAAMAALDLTAPTNPVPAGETEMRRILDAAMEGRIG